MKRVLNFFRKSVKKNCKTNISKQKKFPKNLTTIFLTISLRFFFPLKIVSKRMLKKILLSALFEGGGSADRYLGKTQTSQIPCQNKSMKAVPFRSDNGEVLKK